MDIRNHKQLLQSADEAIGEASYSPRKLMLIHTAIALGVSALLTFLSFVLTRQIDTTGGLAGMGLRSVLETIQSVLDTVVVLILPVWELGALFAALQISRRRDCTVVTLAEGFRRFFPAVRLILLEALLYAGVTALCCYAGMMLYMLSPLSTPMVEAVMPMVEQIATVEQMEALMADGAFVQQMMPFVKTMFIVMAAVCGAVLIPVFYRLRLARYLVLDVPGVGAMAAMTLSGRMTRGNKLALFRLDLRFWWYYLLQAVTIALGVGSELLNLAGITLPLPQDTVFWLFYGVYAVAQLALYTFARAKVEVTFAAVYDGLRETQPQLTGRIENPAE